MTTTQVHLAIDVYNKCRELAAEIRLEVTQRGAWIPKQKEMYAMLWGTCRRICVNYGSASKEITDVLAIDAEMQFGDYDVAPPQSPC